jgi:hypothetical protein
MVVELVLAGSIVLLAAVVARAATVTRRRREPGASLTEAQARQNAAPLTSAIQANSRTDRDLRG